MGQCAPAGRFPDTAGSLAKTVDSANWIGSAAPTHVKIFKDRRSRSVYRFPKIAEEDLSYVENSLWVSDRHEDDDGDTFPIVNEAPDRRTVHARNRNADEGQAASTPGVSRWNQCNVSPPMRPAPPRTRLHPYLLPQDSAQPSSSHQSADQLPSTCILNETRRLERPPTWEHRVQHKRAR